MIALALALASAQPAPIVVRMPSAEYLWVGTEAFCAEGKKIVAAVQSELPIQADAITRTDGMSIICALRTMTWNRFVAVDQSSFREGWQARKQAQWNGIVCGNAAFLEAAQRGWRFTQNLTFKSGERINQDASC